MNIIRRDDYIKKLLDLRSNGLIKIITGLRRSGKSFILNPLFIDELKKSGVSPNHIIYIDCDNKENIKYRNGDTLIKFVKESLIDNDYYFLILDEVQMIDEFESVLNGLLKIRNLDIYVTGSNSKFLSTDIATEFRGRGIQIHIYPLTFAEFYNYISQDVDKCFETYKIYGGLPQTLFLSNDNKIEYLKELFELTYIKDIVSRYKIKKIEILNTLINILASSIGSLTNPLKLTNSFKSNGFKEISKNTIANFLKYLEESLLIKKVERYDVKGKRYISSPSKYYFTDIGLRNAKLNYRQIEESHLMENIIFNELISRGYQVDVGNIEIFENNKYKINEIDFVCNKGSQKIYIQSCLSLETREKTIQEEKSLLNIKDGFKKIIIVKGNFPKWLTEEGIIIISLFEFLLNKNIFDN